jgi:hypothetical protein
MVGDVPALREHNREMFVGLLGLSDHEVLALRTDGVI